MIIVRLPYATFGLIVDVVRRVVTDAPPVARWAVGRSAKFVWDYYDSRGSVTWID